MNWEAAGNYLAAFFVVMLALVASGHAVIYKRDSRAAVLWVGFIWLSPVVGPVLYLLLGINRIRRRATTLRVPRRYPADLPGLPRGDNQVALDSQGWPVPGRMEFPALAHQIARVTRFPMTGGNAIEPLIQGDEAYPAMLQAIESAKGSVGLASYIFEPHGVGEKWVKALSDAAQRGVEVRVLVDATGARYSIPSVLGELKSRGVRVDTFLPFGALRGPVSWNLRNHRKLLVVDGRMGFTGGMNIRNGHVLKSNPTKPIQDVHFRLQGPVVEQMLEVFVADWFFATGEQLDGEAWFPDERIDHPGQIRARSIPDGPDDTLDAQRWTFLGALAAARHRVRIVTPYFLPDQVLIAGLNMAAMRGVRVEILLPEKSNLPVVHWAVHAGLWQVLEKGCRIFLTRPPFDHAKLMVVDDGWSLIGSSNWDPRSYRLNFEYNIEAYDTDFASRLNRLIDQRLEGARPLTFAEANSRPLPVRFRDGIARLFTPFI